MTRLALRLDCGREGYELVDDVVHPRRRVRGEPKDSEWSTKPPVGRDWKDRYDRNPNDFVLRWTLLVLARAKHWWPRSGFKRQPGDIPGVKVYPGPKAPRLEFDDLVQAGFLGVVQALRADDRSRGFATATLVRTCVDRRMIDEMKVWWKWTKNEEPMGAIDQDFDVSDTNRLVQLPDDEDEDDVGGPPADNWATIVETREREMAELVDAMTASRALALRQREVFALRRFEGLTQSETARRLAISERHVRRLERDVLEAMSGFRPFPRVYELERESLMRKPSRTGDAFRLLEVAAKSAPPLPRRSAGPAYDEHVTWAFRRAAEIVRGDWPRSSYVPSRDGAVVEVDFEPLREAA